MVCRILGVGLRPAFTQALSDSRCFSVSLSLSHLSQSLLILLSLSLSFSLSLSLSKAKRESERGGTSSTGLVGLQQLFVACSVNILEMVDEINPALPIIRNRPEFS